MITLRYLFVRRTFYGQTSEAANASLICRRSEDPGLRSTSAKHHGITYAVTEKMFHAQSGTKTSAAKCLLSMPDSHRRGRRPPAGRASVLRHGWQYQLRRLQGSCRHRSQPRPLLIESRLHPCEQGCDWRSGSRLHLATCGSHTMMLRW